MYCSSRTNKRYLDALYSELDFIAGNLMTATDTPALCRNPLDWLEKGEWLAAAKRADVEKVFFVENNPVAVFAECGATTAEKIKAFNRVWCLARPRLLFLASPGEITVYDLAQKPVDKNNPEEWRNLKSLAVLHDIGKVAEEFQRFHRDNIESGRVFGDRHFGDLTNRADKALIRDLKTVRRELIEEGLSGNKVRFAHSLIGRSIFIRYLEDRGVLSEKYFRKVAMQKAGWTKLLNNPPDRFGVDLSENRTFYPRVLADKSFTYALFKSLARHFNGDMFPDLEEEEQTVTPKHLLLIQDLLYGDAGRQKNLFFYSYQFDIVPLDLISSIYEEFYHPSISNDERKNKARQDGAYYTPAVLAEFVLSRILTIEEIKKKPRILDPACGSGIFLVEAFRRIVRYEWHKKKSPLSFDDLKRVLKEQIAGIEVNEEAARITAFSLYLSLLHYLDPPSIEWQMKQGNKLPNLLASKSRSKNDYHSILVGNAFDVGQIESNTLWKERFGDECADIIISNPPWGSRENKADVESKAREKVMLDWCIANNKPIGYKEPSQAFLWRSLDLLRKDGKAGMLVSAGVLFKRGSKSQAFRNQWLDHVRLSEVFNFTHVRKFFFKEADSPFLAVFYDKNLQGDTPVYYWSGKQTAILSKVQSVLLSRHDLHILRNEELDNSAVWKTYWLGQFADRQFIRILGQRKKLEAFVDRPNSGRGYQLASQNKPAEALKNFKNIERIAARYEPLEFGSPPSKVERFGAIGAYTGLRVLVNEGVSEKTDAKGQIVAQYASDPFCFYRSVYGLWLKDQYPWIHKLLLGVLWSSLARYYFFMTSSNWGLWHHKILLDELLQLPVVFDNGHPATKRIIAIVDSLRSYHPQQKDVLHPDGIPATEIELKRREWETELDEAVFELFRLNDEQKDLIRDCCGVIIPFFYNPFNSVGVIPAVEKNDYSWIEKYIRVFSRRWNAYLRDDEEMRAEVHLGAHGNMVAVEFFLADKDHLCDVKPNDNSWGKILERIGNRLPQPMGASRIMLDGLVHIVLDDSIIIIKRNEKRFWTRSLAREDADATICKAMFNCTPKEEGNL